ncbi:MAG: hypothetical protein AAFQ87_04590 [Bacteroidota bacterium]
MSAQFLQDSASEPAPFFIYQKNGLLNYLELNKTKWKHEGPLLFQKPIDICEQSDIPLPQFWNDKYAFGLEWRKQIESTVEAYGLKLRLYQNGDIPAIKTFLEERYSPELAAEICAFDLHRFEEYGHGVILLDENDRVRATIFEVGYHTSEKTSYTIRLAVAEELSGKNLGQQLVIYSSLIAMEYGSRIKRGIIEFDNFRSLYINLNKVGWICDDFIPEIKSLGTFFKIALPLDAKGLIGNRIDQHKVVDLIRSREAEKDYRLLRFKDFEATQQMYQETSFKVVAAIKQEWGFADDMLLALPARSLHLS